MGCWLGQLRKNGGALDAAFWSLPGQGRDRPHTQLSRGVTAETQAADACALPWQRQLAGKEARGCGERLFSLLVLNDQLHFCKLICF